MRHRHVDSTIVQTVLRRSGRALWFLRPRFLTAAAVTVVLALPAYQEHERRASYTAHLEESGGTIQVPRWRPELLDRFPGCTHRPVGLPDHVVAVTNERGLHRMRFLELYRQRKAGTPVSVIGFCVDTAAAKGGSVS